MVLITVIAIQPNEFRTKRSATLAVPAPAVFAQVNDFHNWEAWSPWTKADPAMKKSYQAQPAGTNAVYQRTGNTRWMNDAQRSSRVDRTS